MQLLLDIYILIREGEYLANEQKQQEQQKSLQGLQLESRSSQHACLISADASSKHREGTILNSAEQTLRASFAPNEHERYSALNRNCS